jgi:acyl carrier protein
MSATSPGVKATAAVPQSLSREEIFPRLQTLMQEILQLESAAHLRPESRLREDLQIDSLAMVDMVIALEDRFGVKLPSDINLLASVRTLGDTVELIAGVARPRA